MKCPNKECNYEDGWNDDCSQDVKGPCGHFYVSPVKMERGVYEKPLQLYACPRCGIAFILP